VLVNGLERFTRASMLLPHGRQVRVSSNSSTTPPHPHLLHLDKVPTHWCIISSAFVAAHRLTATNDVQLVLGIAVACCSLQLYYLPATDAVVS
jgi:hypothetical protein